MVAVLLALLLALLLEQGNATQVRIADARTAHDARIMIGTAAATAALAALAGGAVAPLLSPEARLLFLALALGFGATGLLLSLVVPSARRNVEGLAGLGAFVVRRSGENVLFGVGAVAAFTGDPVLTAIGGATGSLAALYAAVFAGPNAVRSPWARGIRGVAGTLLLVAAMLAAADALRLIA